MPRLIPILLLVVLLPGCATLQGVLALRQVQFTLDGLGSMNLAGVELDRIQGFDDVGLVDAARVATALAQGTLPLTFRVAVRADNPDGNPEARLLGLDWTLFLQDRETVSGGLPAAVTIPASGSSIIPVQVRLDLVDFFSGSARDLVELALSLADPDAPPSRLRLEATPTIDTPLGPIRYPRPISIDR